MKALFKSVNLIGDALYISVPLRQWIANHLLELPEIELYIQTLNDHITPLYNGMVRDFDVEPNIVFERPQEQFDFEHTFNVNNAFTLSDQKKQHVAKSYAELLGVDIGDSIGPVYIPMLNDTTLELIKLASERPILLSMFSASCSSRGIPPGLPNKMLPWKKWVPIWEYLRKTFPTVPIKYLGAPTDKPSAEFELIAHELFIDPLVGIPLNRLAILMQSARLLVTIDNGMGHLAATQQTPTFLMYPRCLGKHYILPIGNHRLLSWVHIDPNTVNPQQLLASLKFVVNKNLKE